jgi:hypothetical protein
LCFLLQFKVANDGDFVGDLGKFGQKNRLEMEPISSKIEQQNHPTTHHHKSPKNSKKIGQTN